MRDLTFYGRANPFRDSSTTNEPEIPSHFFLKEKIDGGNGDTKEQDTETTGAGEQEEGTTILAGSLLFQGFKCSRNS